MGRLHGVVDHGADVGGQLVQVELVAQLVGEAFEGAGGVVARAVEAAVHDALDARPEGAEEAGHELRPEHAFRDEGYSGARLDRPGLDALRDAVRDAEVDIVAVLSPDRLARKYAYQALVLEEFRR